MNQVSAQVKWYQNTLALLVCFAAESYEPHVMPRKCAE